MEKEVLLVSPSLRSSDGGVQKLMSKIVKKSSLSLKVFTEDNVDYKGVSKIEIKGVSGIINVNRYIWRKRKYISAVYVSTAMRLHLLLLPIILGMGAICHAHGRDLYISVDSFGEFIQKEIASLVRKLGVCFIAVSEWTREQLVELGADPRDTHVIPNGVDVDRFKNGNGEKVREKYDVGDDQFLLLTVARLDPRKGHRLVIESLTELDDCVYLIAGKGSMEDDLRRLAERKGVSDRVRFAGFVPDQSLPDVYHACDLFAMPSEYMEENKNVEGFGISFLEANAAGKAVVGSRTGGIPTAIRHEYNGHLCDPTVESVLESIRELKNNSELRCCLEENASIWAKKHKWKKVVRKIDKIVKSEIRK